jgi:hypothetical protein
MAFAIPIRPPMRHSNKNSRMLSRADRPETEELRIDGELCAIILPARYDERGIQFFTPGEFSQQLASMSYSTGRIIPAHTHNPVRREVFYTQEVLFIRKGKVRVDFFSKQLEYRTSRVLGPGDVQGPYAGDMDKTRFTAVVPKKFKFE